MPFTFDFTPPAIDARVVIAAAADVGVKSAADYLLSVSQNRCPKETGRLRDSGEVTDYTGLDVGPAGAHVAAVSYGRDDADGDESDTADYAVRQHEERDYHHDVGEWGWLVKSMDSERAAMLGLGGAPIKTALTGL